MIKKWQRPFGNMPTGGWLNLATAGVLALYLFYFAWELMLGRLCFQVGVDFCDFWSAGRVASTQGYAAVYDLEALGKIQKALLPGSVDPSTVAVVPFPYLPIFVVPFQLLSLMSPALGFVVWTTLNLVALFFYLRFFTRKLLQRTLSWRLMLLLLVSLPVFLNAFTGQISVWLLICIGEFMRALADRKPFSGGLWLGGLLLKPQVLVLLVPVLLLHRSFRVLAGFSVSALAFGFASVALAGFDGLVRVAALWTTYASGGASNWIEGMMNWRMLGFHLSAVAPAWLASSLVALAMALTVVVTLYVWRHSVDASSAAWPAMILGVLASTTMVAWHSHIHMAVILLPPLLLLLETQRLPYRAMDYWIFVPALMFLLVVFVPPALARVGVMPNPGAAFVFFFIGAAQLGVNVYLFRWAVRLAPRTA